MKLSGRVAGRRAVMLLALLAVVSAALLPAAGCGKAARPARSGRMAVVANYAASASASLPAPVRRWLAGPVADFAPMAAIVSHSGVGDMNEELSPLLSRVLGARHVVDLYSAPQANPEPGDTTTMDDTLVWVRDYHPLFVRDESGDLTVLHYLSENPNRTAYRPAARPRGPPPGDGYEFYPVPGHADGGRWLKSHTLPILHENGNLVTTGPRVFVTEVIFEDNGQELSRPHLLDLGYRPRGREEVLRVLARALHRRVEDVVVLPQMPYEATGHVDLFVLPLDSRTVMVPSIPEDGFELIDNEWLRRVGRVVRVFLDEQADYLESLGIQVERLPMAPPGMQLPDDGEEFELLVYTPANTLLANVGGRRYAFVPSFSSTSDDPRMVALFAQHTMEHRRFFEARGWEVHIVDSSELVTFLGLIRCVTSGIPE